jgi:hypothetical protein
MCNTIATKIGQICFATIGTLALVTFGSNIHTAVAVPLKPHQLSTVTSQQDDPRVGTKARKEVQAIYKAIERKYVERNRENYDPRTSTGGCSYFEVKDLVLDSLTQDSADLTIIYNRYNCGLHGSNMLKGSYIYNISNVDVFQEKLKVTKTNGLWTVGN